MKLVDILSCKNTLDYKYPDMKEISVNKRKYRISAQLEENLPSLIAVLAFGAGDEYNRVLAQSLLDAKEYFGKGISSYIQSEIERCLEKKEIKLDDCFSFGRTYEKKEKSLMVSKVNSLDVLEDIRESIGGSHTNNIAYIAHPGHVYRVMEIGRKLGLGGGAFIPEEVTWPESDSQLWVRNSFVWFFRESATRIHHWIYGWIPRD